MSSNKVLIILSDAHSFPVKKGDAHTEEETGFFLTELATPLAALLKAGYDVEFASPNGKAPSIDPSSQSLVSFMGNIFEKRREEDLINKMKLEKSLNSPTPFCSIKLLSQYKGVFIPGGHAPLADLGDDAELGRILWDFHNNRKPTAVICHGPYAMLSTKYSQGSSGFAYKGYKITSWSTAEEKLIETLKGVEIEKVEDALRDAGADMQVDTSKKIGYITVDREVVSGANPMAATALGDKFVEMLNTYNA